MSGFCGWFGLEAGDDERRATLQRMAARLTRFDGTEADYLQAGSCQLAGAGLDCGSNLTRAGDWVAAVEGNPEFLDSDLESVRKREGAAAALLRGYRDRGTKVVERMRGGYSLAIAHTGGGEALLAIDRVGGRFPLYYRVVAGGLIFGTMGDAIDEHPRGRSEVDPQALFNYLYFHVVPGSRSARQGLSRLVPGTRLSFRDGRGSIETYWTPAYTEVRDGSVEELGSEFRSLLRQCVGEAAGDDRAGCFLSGGTDSSTVAGYLCDASGTPAPTFSIGFDSERYDEMKYARIAAQHFGTEHHEYYLKPDDVVTLIPRIAELYSEPFGNESAVPAYECARMARDHGVDLLLGGDGGDELFAGNERYAQQKIYDVYGVLPRLFRRALLEPAVFHFPAGEKIWPVRKARGYIRQANVPMPDRTQGYTYLERLGVERILEPDFLRGVDSDEPRRLLREAYDAARAGSMLNRLLAMDLRFTLADNDLPKVSRMCELAGTRVRYPFLDDRLIDFASRLPTNLKLKRLQLRWFFKHALRDFLPNEILVKSKHGMGMPFGLWLLDYAPLQELVRDSLSGLRGRGIIRPAFLDEIQRLHQDQHAIYYGTMIWVLVQLEQWLRHHVDARAGS